MEYIRTKDGVYELTKWQCDLSGETILVKADNKFGNDTVFARDIIKQADNIQELCDRFIIYNPNCDEMIVMKTLKGAKNAIKGQSLDSYIYGAIITTGINKEPILKAVTKPLNSEGELELLWKEEK